jgi:hypothetical protein
VLLKASHVCTTYGPEDKGQHFANWKRRDLSRTIQVLLSSSTVSVQYDMPCQGNKLDDAPSVTNSTLYS